MPPYYIFFRCWPGFSEPFPFDEFNALSGEAFALALDTYAKAELQKPEVQESVLKKREERSDVDGEGDTESVAKLLERALPSVCWLGICLGWYDPPGQGVPFWGRRVWFWSHDSERFAEQLVQQLNNERKPDSSYNPRFGFVNADRISAQELPSIQTSVGAVKSGNFPSDRLHEEEINCVRVARKVTAYFQSEWRDRKNPPKRNGGSKGAQTKKRRGRRPKPETAQRAKFAQPLLKKGYTFPQILEKYHKKHPSDIDATADALRGAVNRVEEAAEDSDNR